MAKNKTSKFGIDAGLFDETVKESVGNDAEPLNTVIQKLQDESREQSRVTIPVVTKNVERKLDIQEEVEDNLVLPLPDISIRKKRKERGKTISIYFDQDVYDFLAKYNDYYSYAHLVNAIIYNYMKEHDLQ